MTRSNSISIPDGLAQLNYNSVEMQPRHLMFGVLIGAAMLSLSAWQANVPMPQIIRAISILSVAIAVGWVALRLILQRYYKTPLRVDATAIHGPGLEGSAAKSFEWARIHKLKLNTSAFGPVASSLNRPAARTLMQDWSNVMLIVQSKDGEIFQFQVPVLTHQQWVDLKAVLTKHSDAHGITFQAPVSATFN